MRSCQCCHHYPAHLGKMKLSSDATPQVTWELLSRELPSTLKSPERSAEMGAFVGIQQMEYSSLAMPFAASFGPYTATGGSLSVAAGRISFTYGIKGPAVSIDTACSSSLVAIHVGMQHVQAAPQRSALTAGVNLTLSETTTAVAQAAGMLTMDGRCKALDQGADGYVRYASRAMDQYF